MDDWQLLRSYGCDDAEDAFTEIVRRRVNLVYSAALRQVHEAEFAKDVTQVVFANLASRAKSLKAKGTLAGWLYRDAFFTSREMLRRERRRVAHEQEAVAMQDGESSRDWARIKPRLDVLLSQLGQSDRDALLLRYFEQSSLKEVGSSLGMEEDAARKRVSRALERLRMLFARQGISTTSDALAGLLSTHAVQAAPAGLAAGILATSLTAGSAAAATGTTTFIDLLTMTTKLKSTLAATAVLAAVGTPLYVQHEENKSLRVQNQALVAQTSQVAALQAENEELSNRLAAAATNGASNEQQPELNRLRGEVARLRGEVSETQQLRQEISRLRSGRLAASGEANSNSDALMAYLGEAILPPANINPAYSKEGLSDAIQQAAQLAGVSLQKLEIETSEFPFLAGVVADSAADVEKLTAQLKRMPSYEFGANAGGSGILAFNITPYGDVPSQERRRITRRTLIRTGVLSDQLKAR